MQLTVKLVTEAPPFELAVNAIVALPLPAVAVPMVGALGTVRGVTDVVLDALLVPTAFVAVTLHEYATPFVSDVTVMGLAPPVPVRVVCPLAEHETV